MKKEKNDFNRKDIPKLEDLNREDLLRFIVEMFHRTIFHHSMWFFETARQLGMSKAADILTGVWSASCSNQIERLGKSAGFETAAGLPKAFAEMPREKLLAIADTLAVNWYVQDGIWFTALEAACSIADAKHCNDTCQTHYTAFEAVLIKNFLGLSERAGIEGLRRALAFRMQARLNVQSIIDDEPDTIILQMNDCRVQSARRRKGLPSYDCKSAGLVEYPGFAKTIDERIETACIACPPDEHPPEWFCSWRFTLK